MKQLALALVLTAVSGSAAAAWTDAGVNNELMAGYVDRDTITHTGYSVMMWNLLDFKTAQVAPSGELFWSTMSLYEFDCQKEERRLMAFSWRSGHMGLGTVVHTESTPSSKFTPVAPETVAAVMLQIACGKKQAAQQAQSNPLQDAVKTFNSEADATCRDPALQPYFVKSPCDIFNATLEQLSDSSKINDEQKAALQKARAAFTDASKKLIQAYRQYGGQKGNETASLLEKTDGQSDANQLDLYSGKITWGEYNRRRKDSNVQLRDQYNDIWQSE